jgi:hypothetical protein
MSSKIWSRRQLLGGTGVALALPWLETLSPRTAAAAAAGAPRRYIGIYFPNGTASFWTPGGAGANWTMSPILEPLTPNKAQVTVLGNVQNYSPWGGHIEPSHGHNCASAWTGVQANGTMKVNSGISIDQAIADQLVTANGGKLPTPLHSLQVGLSTLDSSPDGIPPQHSRSISWKSATEPLYKLVSPQAVFDRLVGGGLPMGNMPPMPDPLAERRRILKKSALDYVIEDARGLQGRLSASDRLRLDKYLSSVRTLEQRASDPTMPTALNCKALARPTQTFGVGNTPTGYDRGQHATLMIDLIVMAIQCDLTRVVSFMLDDARSDFVYNFLKGRKFTATGSTPATNPLGGYHGLQHAGDTNGDFATIGWWNCERANELATKLAALNEGASGNVLQNTVITFLSGMHGGNHDGKNLPVALIGGGGGVLKMNQFINFTAPQNLADVHLTILQKVFGSPLTKFGTPINTTSGVIPELLV